MILNLTTLQETLTCKDYAIIENMSSTDKYRQTAINFNFLGTIFISLLMITFTIWFFKTLSDHQAITPQKLEERYVSLINNWLQNESRTLTTAQRQSISECTLTEDPGLIYIRKTSTNQAETDQTDATTSQTQAFLDNLESYINKQDNDLTTNEIKRIKTAINICKSRNGV